MLKMRILISVLARPIVLKFDSEKRISYIILVFLSYSVKEIYLDQSCEVGNKL